MGLSLLITRMYIYVSQMTRLSPWSWFDASTDYIEYLVTAIRYDLRDGIEMLTDEILATGNGEVDISEDVITIVSIVGCVVILLVFFFHTCLVKKMIVKISRHTDALEQLLPIDEDEKEMELLPTMMVHYPAFDMGRMGVVDCGRQVLEAIRMNETAAVMTQTYDTFMRKVFVEFSEEEKLMRERNYEDLNDHTADHLLIRQRLTLILDQLRLRDEATTSIARLYFTRIFGRHFTEDDVEMGKMFEEDELVGVDNKDEEENS